MIRRLNQQQQRNIALALLVLAVAVVISVTLVPLWSTNASYAEKIGQMQDRLARLRQAAISDQQLRPRYEQARASQLATGHYLASNTEAVAAAEMQRLLKGLTIRHGLQVISTQILPAGQDGQFVRVALRARLRGILPGIVDTLYAIETNNTFLFLDNVSLRNSMGRRRAQQTSSTQFELDLDLIAFMPGTL